MISIPDWGVGGTVIDLNWGSQPDGRYDGVYIPWRGSLPACPTYLHRSLENMRATVGHVREDLHQ